MEVSADLLGTEIEFLSDFWAGASGTRVRNEDGDTCFFGKGDVGGGDARLIH